VHVVESDPSPRLSDRVGEMAERVGLSPSEIRRFSSLGIEILAGLGEATRNALAHRAALRWSGWPSYDQILARSAKSYAKSDDLRNLGVVRQGNWRFTSRCFAPLTGYANFICGTRITIRGNLLDWTTSSVFCVLPNLI